MHATRSRLSAIDGAARLSHSAMHARLKRAFGRARDYQCVTCGEPAREWAYDWSDPAPRYDVKTGLAFSPDCERYNPMCLSCHRLMDCNRPVAERWVHPRPRVTPLPKRDDVEVMAAAADRRRDLLAAHSL